jgi:hypothetical protein
MKAFNNIEQGKSMINDLLIAHKTYIIENLTTVDEDVVNQKTRMYKFFCWFIWGHIFKGGICARCGKSKA